MSKRLGFLGSVSVVGLLSVGLALALTCYEAPPSGSATTTLIPENRPEVGEIYIVHRQFLVSRLEGDLQYTVAPHTVNDPALIEAMLASGEAFRLAEGARIEVVKVVVGNGAPYCGIQTEDGEAFAHTYHFGIGEGVDAWKVVTP